MNALVQSLQGMNSMRLAMIGLIGAGLVLAFIFLAMRMTSPVLSPLYSNLSPDDSAVIATELGAMGVEFQVASSGSQILVKSPDVLRVRMALHTGAAETRDGDYFGQALNRVARILSTAHGGQVLISLPTQELVRDHLPAGVQLRHLGEHRLKDLARAEHLYQLVAPDLPSEFAGLRSLESVANNLPVQLTSFIGREREMAEVDEPVKVAAIDPVDEVVTEVKVAPVPLPRPVRREAEPRKQPVEKQQAKPVEAPQKKPATKGLMVSAV